MRTVGLTFPEKPNKPQTKTGSKATEQKKSAESKKEK